MSGKRNKHPRMLSHLTLLVLATFAGPALGAVSMFLKMDTIPGEATDKGHPEWIDVLSFGQGVSNSVQSTITGPGGGGAGKATGSDFLIRKYMDKATPELTLACCEGRLIPEVTLQLVNTGGGNTVPFMEYKLTHVYVASYNVVGNAGDDPRPTEEISLNYESIQWTYTEFNAAGNPKKDPVISLWNFVLSKMAQ